MECLLCVPGSAPGHPPAGATSHLSSPEGEAASNVGLPPQAGAVCSVLPTPHCSLSPVSGFLSLDLGLQSSGGCPGQPEHTPGGLSAACAGAAGSTWEPWGGSCQWGWSPEVREADPPLCPAGVTPWAFPLGPVVGP